MMTKEQFHELQKSSLSAIEHCIYVWVFPKVFSLITDLKYFRYAKAMEKKESIERIKTRLMKELFNK